MSLDVAVVAVAPHALTIESDDTTQIVAAATTNNPVVDGRHCRLCDVEFVVIVFLAIKYSLRLAK